MYKAFTRKLRFKSINLAAASSSSEDWKYDDESFSPESKNNAFEGFSFAKSWKWDGMLCIASAGSKVIRPCWKQSKQKGQSCFTNA